MYFLYFDVNVNTQSMIQLKYPFTSELDFAGVTGNSLDGTSDRDFISK